MLCSLCKGSHPLWARAIPKSSRSSRRVFEVGEGSTREPPPAPVPKGKGRREGSKGRGRAGAGQGQDRGARACARTRSHAPPPWHPPPTHTMGSRRLALRRDQLGGFSQRICHPSSCRSGGAGGGFGTREKSVRGELRLRRPAAGSGRGDTPNPPGPRAPPLRRRPPRASGGGGSGEALTSHAASANRSCPFRAPKGFPGQSRDQGRNTAATTPSLGLKEGARLSGETEAGPRQGGGPTQTSGCPRACRQHCPERARERRESHSGTARRRAQTGEGVSQAVGRGFLCPQAPGPGSASVHPLVP